MTAATAQGAISKPPEMPILPKTRQPAPITRRSCAGSSIATTFWGVVAFAMGTFIAFQLAFPVLNLGLEWTTFGRLRPVHTSAAIFAFGGNALIATSLYVVQRTCRATLFGGPALAAFLFWGYQLFIVLAASGYVLGVTQGANMPSPNGMSISG